MIIRKLTAPVTFAIGVGLSTTAVAAPTSSAADREPAYVTSSVMSGALQGVPGNRHQVLVDKSHRAEVGGWIRSWSCPDGATVTMSWVSSRCDHRLTQDLRPKWGTDPAEWLSSTTRSATLHARDLVGVNRSTGHVRRIPASLTFVAASDARRVTEAGATFWSPTRAWGSIGMEGYWDTGAWVGQR